MSKTLSVVNDNGSLSFTNQGSYSCSSTNNNQSTTGEFNVSANSHITIKTMNGSLALYCNNDKLSLTSNSSYSNAIVIEAINPTGGIITTTGSGGYSLITANGDVSILPQGANVDIGVSPIGTPAAQQTQNITLECFNDMSANAGDMYFVSSDVISFVSNTGDIQFGTTSNGIPIIKFQDGNVLINQSSSTQDYQLDVGVTHPSATHPGYNGIMINSFQSNVASDITLQTSNTLGDGTQGIISMGVFGSDNLQANFQSYLAYQSNSMIIRLDGPTYSPGTSYLGFGNDFTYNDIRRQIYWPTLDKQDVITGLGVWVSPTSDTANVSVSGAYTGNNSRVYLMQIDSVGTPNTFMWSNDGGATFQRKFVPIPVSLTPIILDSGLAVTFTQSVGFSINQQFTFQAKITALVSSFEATPTEPTTFYTLQPYYSYIKTVTPSDIVIKTNNTEKMRITGDGAIGIQQKIPTACLDLNSNYNKVLLANQTTSGYQLNPSVSYLTSGGYMLVWNSQDDPSELNFNVIGQRYLADGSQYDNNFLINNITSGNQSFPSVAGQRGVANSNHYIVTWSGLDAISGLNKVYFQIFHNNTPIQTIDIPVDTFNSSTSNQLYPRAAGLYNGNYVITWAADNTSGGAGIYSVYSCIIDDTGVTGGIFQVSTIGSTTNANFPYPAGLPSDDAYVPNGFVVGFMTAIDAIPDPRYTISVRVMNADGSAYSGVIPITAVGNASYSSISDGLLSVGEINFQEVNPVFGNGGFLMAFYRNYQADVSLYNPGDNLVGELSGATATIQSLDGINRVITVQDVSNRLLVGEEIQIASSNVSVGNVIEKIAAIDFLTNTTANITLDNGSKNVVAYRFSSNLTQTSDALWNVEVNTTPLFADTDRFSGNVNVFQYKRPLAAVTIDNIGTALVTWSNGSIPSVYYQLINVQSGSYIGIEQRLTSGYDGLKQRDQVTTRLQSIEGNDYGFVIGWDNQSLDLQDTGIYHQLIGYEHSLLSLQDGNSAFIVNHSSQCGIGTMNPMNSLHVKSPSSSAFNDPANPAGIIIQNTSTHIITNQTLQSVEFLDGANNTLNIIRSINTPRYSDLAPYPESLIGFYKFDETQGTQAQDSSPYSSYLYNNSPVFINTAAILENFDTENAWCSGLINNALLFDGNNNYCYVEAAAPNNLNTTLETVGAMSVSYWVNIPTNIVYGSTYDIVSNGGNLSIPGTYVISAVDIASNGNMKLEAQVSIKTLTPPFPVQIITITETSGANLNDDGYHHIVVTIQETGGNVTVEGYIDGELNCSNSAAGTLAGASHLSSNTYIGSRDASTGFYRGYLDELRFYKTILAASDVSQLFSYGNPTAVPKGALILNANDSTSYNLGLILDDTGKLNNLSSKPLPYSVLSGELVAYNSNVTITGVGTLFLSELTVGDILTFNLTTSPEDFTVITITSDILLTLDSRPYTGVSGSSKPYQSVLRRPSIYTFFDNGDNIRGYLDSYGNLMIGDSRPSTMLEIAGNSTSLVNIPEITITNTTSGDNSSYGRKTAINFRGYNTTNPLNPPVTLGHIEVAHQGTAADNRGIMRFFTNSDNMENNVMSLTSNGQVGINQNTPLGLIHATSTPYYDECNIILQSGSNANINISNSSVFDERSHLHFVGLTSINDTISTNINNRVLASVAGSNDSNNHTLNGRLDFLTNFADNNDNGIESRMSITHSGKIGLGIQQPANPVTMAPELRLASGEINQVSNITYDGTYSYITINNNILNALSVEQRNMLIGGTIIIANRTLSAFPILAITSIAPPIFTVAGNQTSIISIGQNCYIHYQGINVSSGGFLGVNTTTPNAPFTVSGAVSHSIIKVSSNTTLDIAHHAVLVNTTASNVTITLPTNSSSITGRMYRIKNIGTNPTNVVNVNPGSSTIDGSAGLLPIPQGLGFSSNSIVLQSDGTDWWFL